MFASPSSLIQRAIAPLLVLLGAIALSGCGPVQIPKIDPTGERILAPGQSTTLVTASQRGSLLGLTDPVYVAPEMPPLCPEIYQCPDYVGEPPCPPLVPEAIPASPVVNGPPTTLGPRRNVSEGAIVLSPTRIIAPINSDVVVFGGLCAADGFYRKRQKLEWSLSQESVGHFVDVREGSLSRLRRVLGGESGKQGTSYAVGFTSSSEELIDRGTPTSTDDLIVYSGQGWVSLTSPSEGTSYVSCMAPKAEAWDRRRQTATIHWVDATWDFPPQVTVPAGSAHQLTTLVKRATTGEPIQGWNVNYTVLSGSMPSGFAPAGASSVQGLTTNSLGQATATLQQPTDQIGPGTTQVRVDISRPGRFPGDPDQLPIATSVVTIRWTSPALTLVASGLETAGLDSPFSYRIEVSNPGDQVAPGVTLNVVLPTNLTPATTNPPAEFVGGTLLWNIGDLPPGNVSRTFELSVSAKARGNARTCFRLQSTDTRLPALEKCLDTMIAAPCLGMQIDGRDEAQVGETVHYLIRLQNLCDEILRDVRLVDTYGEGLEAPGMQSPLEYPAFDLEPGGVREIDLSFVVQSPGTHCHVVQVTSAQGHSAEGRRCIAATQPVRRDVDLQVDSVEEIRVLDDSAIIRATLRNTGNVAYPASAVLFESAPELQIVSATDGMQLLEQGLQWRLKELPVGSTVILEALVRGLQPSPAASYRFTLLPDDGNQIERVGSLRIVPAEQPERPMNPAQPQVDPDDDVEVPDPRRTNQTQLLFRALDEPVAVGDEITYVVTVVNDRTVADREVTLRFELPEGMTFVGVAPNSPLAPASRLNNDRSILMQARRELRPGEQFGFSFTVRALQAGRREVLARVSSQLDPGGRERRVLSTITDR